MGTPPRKNEQSHQSRQTNRGERPTNRGLPLAERLVKFHQFLIDAITGGLLAGSGGRLRPERLAKTFEICAQRDPRLLDCAPESLLSAFVEAAGVGLEPNTPLEHAALKANYVDGQGAVADFQVTLRGLIVLAHRTGVVASVCARLVYAEEEFDIRYGTTEMVDHVPLLGAGVQHGAIVAAYAIVRLHAGGLVFEAMSIDELEDIRQRWARDPNGGAWQTDTGEMYKKTVLRRVMKLVPIENDEMARAIRQPEPRTRPQPVPAEELSTPPAKEAAQS
jgi:recombination protein RecT